MLSSVIVQETTSRREIRRASKRERVIERARHNEGYTERERATETMSPYTYNDLYREMIMREK